MNNYIQPLSVFLTSEMPNIDIGNASNGVVNISEAISKYGIAIVIMAVFFVIFMILIIIMLYSNTRMINRIMENNANSNQHDQELISKFVDSAFAASKGQNSREDSEELINTITNKINEAISPLKQSIQEQEKENETEEIQHNEVDQNDYHKDLVGAYINVNMAFKNISRATMSSLGCDRIAIYVFHNGNKSMYGLPFFKMSCIHEWTSKGTNTLRGKSHMDMPLHVFSDFIESLHKYGVYKAENIDVTKSKDHSIESFVSYSNTKALYLVAIKNDDGIISGFVSAEFDQVDTFEEDDKRDMDIKQILDNMISKIAPIVSTQYVYRPNISNQ